jgi:hypothetical protein
MSENKPQHAYLSLPTLGVLIGRYMSPVGDKNRKGSLIALSFYQNLLEPEQYIVANYIDKTLVPMQNKPTDKGPIRQPALVTMTLSQVLEFFTDNKPTYFSSKNSHQIAADILDNIKLLYPKIDDIRTLADQLDNIK